MLLVLPALLSAATPSPEVGRRAALARGARAPQPVAPAPDPFNGRDLASAPVTTDTKTLPDIFAPQSEGSHSYVVRLEVTVIPATYPNGVTGKATPTIYWRKDKNLFYLQSDGLGSSTHHFYGPFAGDPTQNAATQPASQPTTRATQ
jgi:hypothetical protein